MFWSLIFITYVTVDALELAIAAPYSVNYQKDTADPAKPFPGTAFPLEEIDKQ